MLKIPKKISERLTKEIKKFQKILSTARDQDVNESDTVTIITDMLASVFGFYKYTEITSEQSIKSTFCDLAVKLDGKIKYLIEVKAIGLNLKENHLHQAINYGATHGIQWVVLTNGIDWEIYKIKFEKPLDYDLVCSFNFIELNPKKQDKPGSLGISVVLGLRVAALTPKTTPNPKEPQTLDAKCGKRVFLPLALSIKIDSLYRILKFVLSVQGFYARMSLQAKLPPTHQYPGIDA